jgi:hypothetical protein
VLALEEVMHGNSPQSGGDRGDDSTNGAAHAVRVSARPRPETDSTDTGYLNETARFRFLADVRLTTRMVLASGHWSRAGTELWMAQDGTVGRWW